MIGCCLELTLGRDDLRAPLALRLRLPGHRALHPGRDLDVLHLDDGDLDAPGRGRLVDDRLEDRVDLVALGEELVEDVLAEHRAQGRLRDLRGGDHVVLDLHDRVVRLDDAEVRHRVDAHGDVVLRDDLLRRDVERHRAQVDPDHPVDERDDQEDARPLGLREESPEAEDHAALVLARDLHREEREQEQEREDDDEGEQTRGCEVHQDDSSDLDGGSDPTTTSMRTSTTTRTPRTTITPTLRRFASRPPQRRAEGRGRPPRPARARPERVGSRRRCRPARAHR